MSCGYFERPQIVNLLRPVPSITEIAIAGDPVGIELGTSDRKSPAFSIVDGGGTLQIVGNIVQVLDPDGIDLDDGEISVTVAAAGYPNRTFRVRVKAPEWLYAIDFARRVPHPALTFFSGRTSTTTEFQDYKGVTRMAASVNERVIVGGRRVEQLYGTRVRDNAFSVNLAAVAANDVTGYYEISATAATSASFIYLPLAPNSGSVAFRFSLKRGSSGTAQMIFNARHGGGVTDKEFAYFYIESGPGGANKRSDFAINVVGLTDEETTVCVFYTGLSGSLRPYFTIGNGTVQPIGSSVFLGRLEAYALTYLPNERITKGRGETPFGIDGVRWYDTDEYGAPIPDSVLRGALLDGSAGHKWELPPGSIPENEPISMFLDAQIDGVSTGGQNRAIELFSAATGDDVIRIGVTNSYWRMSAVNDTVLKFITTATPQTAGEPMRIGVRAAAGSYYMRALDGSDNLTSASDAYAGLPTVSRVFFGAQGGGLRFTMRRALIFRGAMSDEQIARVMAVGLKRAAFTSAPEARAVASGLAENSYTESARIWNLAGGLKTHSQNQIARLTAPLHDVYVLYDVQTYLVYLARAAIQRRDWGLIKDISDILDLAFAEQESTGLGLQWVQGAEATPLPGQNIDLIDRQFLSLCAEMAVGMQAATGRHGDFLRARSLEWSLAVARDCTQNGDTWQSSYVTAVAGKPPTLSNVMLSDRVLFGGVMLGALAVLAARDRGFSNYWAANGFPMRARWRNDLDEINRLINERISFHASEFGDVADFDRGYWDTYSDSAFAGYTSNTPPLTCDGGGNVIWAAGAQPGVDLPPPPTTIGYDISHAIRLPMCLPLLVGWHDEIEVAFGPITRIVSHAAGFARMVTRVIQFGTPERPQFWTYTDGSKGWYRVQYHGPCSAGYRPGHPAMQSSIPDGGYFVWLRADQSLHDLVDQFLKRTIESKQSDDFNWLAAQYPVYLRNENGMTRASMYASVAVGAFEEY